MRPTTRYARSGDYSIAYQVIGDAGLDLVFVFGFVSHVEYAWEDPDLARFLERLASFSRLILFDKRGTGLSDRVPVNKLPTLEERMDDVRAVMDAAGSDRAVLFGISEGGPMSMLFATTYPERVTALVLYAVTPRFALSTSEAMLEVCQTLMGEHPGVRFQTHINENREEVREVARLSILAGAMAPAASSATDCTRVRFCSVRT